MLPNSHAFPPARHLVGSTRDEEPLVNAWVDWCRGKILVGWNGRKLVRVDTAWRVLDGKVGTVNMSDGTNVQHGLVINSHRDIAWLGLASDELLPSLSTLTDNISGVPVIALLASHTKAIL